MKVCIELKKKLDMALETIMIQRQQILSQNDTISVLDGLLIAAGLSEKDNPRIKKEEELLTFIENLIDTLCNISLKCAYQKPILSNSTERKLWESNRRRAHQLLDNSSR